MPSALAPLRADWRTVRRPGLDQLPRAVAAGRGVCGRCGAEVYPDQPIWLVGSVVSQAPDGRRTVELSGAVWVCCPQMREVAA